MRLLILLAVLGLGVAAVPTAARAQVPAMQRADLGPGGAPATPAHATQEHPKGRALFFWLSALITIGGAILMITRRNAVMAVMCLVLSFLGLAALYVMLYAHFLAVIQVLVYAGAIMVLFVFVIMILNKEEEEPWALRGIIGKGLAGLALLYFAIRLIQILWAVPATLPSKGTPPLEFGTTKAMADVLFGSYLFPFEAVSLVLLIAVVGALVLAHPAHPNVGEEELS